MLWFGCLHLTPFDRQNEVRGHIVDAEAERWVDCCGHHDAVATVVMLFSGTLHFLGS
jgi:hypothetical protein